MHTYVRAIILHFLVIWPSWFSLDILALLNVIFLYLVVQRLPCFLIFGLSTEWDILIFGRTRTSKFLILFGLGTDNFNCSYHGFLIFHSKMSYYILLTIYVFKASMDFLYNWLHMEFLNSSSYGGFLIIY